MVISVVMCCGLGLSIKKKKIIFFMIAIYQVSNFTLALPLHEKKKKKKKYRNDQILKMLLVPIFVPL